MDTVPAAPLPTEHDQHKTCQWCAILQVDFSHYLIILNSSKLISFYQNIQVYLVKISTFEQHMKKTTTCLTCDNRLTAWNGTMQYQGYEHLYGLYAFDNCSMGMYVEARGDIIKILIITVS